MRFENKNKNSCSKMFKIILLLSILKQDSFSLACDRGLYGIECNETCGNCRDADQCSNTNGSCLTGCDDGYQGDLCRTRLYIVT